MLVLESLEKAEVEVAEELLGELLTEHPLSHLGTVGTTLSATDTCPGGACCGKARGSHRGLGPSGRSWGWPGQHRACGALPARLQGL